MPSVLKMATPTTKDLLYAEVGKDRAINKNAHSFKWNRIGTLIFVGCFGSKPELGPQLHETQGRPGLLHLQMYLFCFNVTPKA
jgi:hypothetical protein